ncbi:hypothetical protein SELMODRAFT_73361 [Selaginella moellendorffii]|uniref:Pentacotripeptide-repeat region of PRORP domain-containing protein n=1 Tax=Selaginella moellendorffii TaxID=88036 RepID=D8QPL3_SELML|nr:hypothetical protein SELMODRAFT_73361 [Selaginella moellendorffii]
MHDTIAYNSMIAAMGSGGQLCEAEKIFEKMPERNIISWNSMLSCYTQARYLCRAKCLFDKMPRTNEISWTSILQAFEKSGDIEQSMFDRLVCRSCVAWTALIHGYARLGHLRDAEDTFQRMPLRDLHSWSLMIVSYERNEKLEEARRAFGEMPEHDEVSWNTMLAASFRIGDTVDCLEKLVASMPKSLSGCWVLIAAWSKHGQTENAKKIFDESLARGEIDGYCWNAMLGAYVQNGQGLEAIEIFREMICHGAKPDEASFLNLFTACSQAGLLEESRDNFVSMLQDHMMKPTREHFGVMMDSLARNGRLEEAKEVAEDMPFKPDSVTCRILLGGCKLHRDEGLAKAAGESAIRSAAQEKSSANYVILSSVYQFANSSL